MALHVVPAKTDIDQIMEYLTLCVEIRDLAAQLGAVHDELPLDLRSGLQRPDEFLRSLHDTMFGGPSILADMAGTGDFAVMADETPADFDEEPA